MLIITLPYQVPTITHSDNFESMQIGKFAHEWIAIWEHIIESKHHKIA